MLAALVASTCQTFASDFIAEARFSCSDPLMLKSSAIGALLPSMPSLSVDSRNPTQQFVTFSQKDTDAGVLPLGKKFLISQTDLTAVQISSLKKLIASQANSRKIPWYVQPFLPSPAVFEQFFIKKMAEQAQAFLFDGLSNSAVTLDTYAIFVADGGQLIRSGVVTENKDIKGQYAYAEMSEYSIQLGKERRAFLLGTCLYPARGRVTKIVLTDKSGTLDTFAEKSQTEWLWTSPVIKRTVNKFAEDDQNIYFQEICALTDYCIRHRINKWNGAWGTSFEQDGPNGSRFYPADYNSVDPPEIIKVVLE